MQHRTSCPWTYNKANCTPRCRLNHSPASRIVCNGSCNSGNCGNCPRIDRSRRRPSSFANPGIQTERSHRLDSSQRKPSHCLIKRNYRPSGNLSHTQSCLFLNNLPGILCILARELYRKRNPSNCLKPKNIACIFHPMHHINLHFFFFF